jgi:hypothetical protein
MTPAAGKRFGLLLYLVTQPGFRAARATLHELLFPPTKNGRHGLRELVYQLRRFGVELDGDAHTIELCVRHVRRDWIEIVDGIELSSSLLRSAEAGFLPGYRPAYSEAFGVWYDRFHICMVGALCRGILRDVQRSLSVNDLGAAERAARTCLALEPSNGQATVALAYILRRREWGDETASAGAIQ